MKRIAILLPWFSFFLREKYTQGYICLALQISIIGWPVASAWAIFTLVSNASTSKNNFVFRTNQPLFDRSDAGMKHIA
jgi:hypothetical protein